MGTVVSGIICYVGGCLTGLFFGIFLTALCAAAGRADRLEENECAEDGPIHVVGAETNSHSAAEGKAAEEKEEH